MTKLPSYKLQRTVGQRARTVRAMDVARGPLRKCTVARRRQS